MITLEQHNLTRLDIDKMLPEILNTANAHLPRYCQIKKAEQMIIIEVINSHEHDLADNSKLKLSVTGSTLHITRAGSLQEHIDQWDMDTELLAPEPYDDLYIHYLDQRLALSNNDTKRFNVAATMYNNALLTYQQYCNRTYKTKKVKSKLLNHEVL